MQPYDIDRDHRTVLTVFTVSEESGSSLFSLLRKNLEAHCFHYFGRFWKLTDFTAFTGFTDFTALEESGSSLVLLFSDCWVSDATLRRMRPQNCSHCFHCFGRIWKLTGFTFSWLFC